MLPPPNACVGSMPIVHTEGLSLGARDLSLWVPLGRGGEAEPEACGSLNPCSQLKQKRQRWVGGFWSHWGGLLNWCPNRLGRGWIRSAFLSTCYRTVGKGPLAPSLLGKGDFDLLPHEPQRESPGIPRRGIHRPFGLGRPPAKPLPPHLPAWLQN